MRKHFYSYLSGVLLFCTSFWNAATGESFRVKTDEIILRKVDLKFTIDAWEKSGRRKTSPEKNISKAEFLPPLFTAEPLGPNSVELRLTDRSSEDESYEVTITDRDYTFYQQVYLEDSGRTVILVAEDVEPGRNYLFHINVIFKNGDSQYRVAEASVTTPGIPPLIHTRVGTDMAYIDVTNNNGLSYTNLYRSLSRDSGYTLIWSTEDWGNFSIVDDDLTPGTTYYYKAIGAVSVGEAETIREVTTPDIVGWYAPQMTVTEVTSNNIKVTITDRSYRDERYELTYDHFDGTFYEEIILPDSGETVVINVPVDPGATYTLNLDVFFTGDTGAPDRVATRTVSTPFIQPQISAGTVGATEAELNITNANPYALIEIYRSTFPNDGYIFLNRIEPYMDSYEDEGLEPGNTYYYKVRVRTYEGELRVSAFSNVIEVTTPDDGSVCNTGSIEREVWNNIAGTDVSAIPVHTPPSSLTTLTLFEAPSNQGSNYGARIRGYVCPPTTGYYTFWIASDDKSELWLSGDASPEGKVKIASVTGHTAVRQWTKYASQQSEQVFLFEGTRYYIEALHKESSGGDHLAVGWRLPDGTLQRPIAGSHLVKYEAEEQCESTGSIKWDVWTNQPGTTINYNVLTTPPDATTLLNSFESPRYYGNSYLSRASGYVCVPQSGNYTFWIASDDKSELWLSTDDNPANKVKIASVTNFAPYLTWDKYTTQKSVAIALEAGRRYYIEAVHKEGSGNDYLAVGWQLPDGTMERPIPGNRLIPFEGDMASNCAEEPGGYLEREIWRNITGTSVAGIPVDTDPDEVLTLDAFETSTYFANNYGSRARGYVCVPATGAYRFWVSGDDNTELWLSTDDTPAGKVRIAFVSGSTAVRQWDKYASQQSALIHLTAGYKYYIEVLHKEANGNDHFAVGWQLPDGALERPISGDRLIPYRVEGEANAARVVVNRNENNEDADRMISLSPNPVTNHRVTLGIASDAFEGMYDAEIRVVSLTGEVVHQETIRCADGNCSDTQMNLNSDIQPGIYVVNVVSGGKRWLKKMIVK